MPIVASICRVPEALKLGKVISCVTSCLALSCTLGAGMASGTEIPFAAAVDIAASLAGAAQVATGDIDGDGAPDAVGTASTAGGVLWWWNANGDGSAWTSFTVDNAFAGAGGVVAVDLDLDGDLDLLATARGANDVHWWENDGTPTNDTTPDAGGNFWTEHVIESNLGGARSVVSADLDGDGDPDVIAAGSTLNAVAWWENDGSPADDVGGDGNSWTQHAIDVAFGGAASVFIADVDCDGDLDVVAAAAIDDDVVWWENDGDPTDNATDDGSGNFWTEHVIDSSFDEARSVIVSDYDHDGDPDVLAAAETAGVLKWWENDGSPEDEVGGDGNSWTAHTIDAAFAGARDIAVRDLDGDGDRDVLAAALVDDDVAWYESDGTPADGGTVKRTIDGSFDGAAAVASVDIDGDGDLDLLATAFAGNKITWWKNETIHGSALFPQDLDVDGSESDPLNVALGDIDRDGDLDIVSGNGGFGQELNWWENASGDGSIWTERLIGAVASTPDELAVGDLDGDGDLDVLVDVSGVGQAFGWWENDGTPVDGGWTEHELDADSQEILAIEVVDLDGDGDLDIVHQEKFLDLVLWRENDGTACSPGCSWPERAIDNAFTRAQRIATADVDRDGDLDVVGLSPSLGVTVWWENDGTPADNTTDDGSGNFWTEHGIAADTFLFVDMAIGDVDGDGDIDVIGGRTTPTSEIAWWENDGSPAGDSSWTVHTVPTAQPFSAVVIQVEDFDRDGDLDLLLRDNPAEVSWFSNDAGDGSAWTELPISTSLSADDLDVGDLDRDGYPDIVAPISLDDRISWWPNGGGQFALVTTDTSPGGLLAGQTDDVLEVGATHLGRVGDSAAELVTLELLFEETAGDPLSTAEAGNLFDGIDVYLDDGSGSFDVTDSLVVGSGAPLLINGVQTIAFVDGAVDVQLAAGTPRTYFVVVDLAAGAAAATPNSFIVTHLTETSSTAEDSPNDISLRMEFAANVTTATATAQSSCQLLTLASSSGGGDPIADPTDSTGCPAGQYVAGETIQLTAAPDMSFIIDSWVGTDDDSSTALTNVVTMPNGPRTVTVNYLIPDVVAIEAPSAINVETFEACVTVKIGDTDGSGGGNVVQVNQNGLATIRAGTGVEFFDQVQVLGDMVVEIVKPAGCP